MKPDFQKSTETLALIELLKAAPVGDTVSYAAMSDCIGCDLQSHRHYLATAIKTLFGDGIPFGTVRNAGVKRLAATEIPGIGKAARLHFKRTARRARHRMGTIAHMNDVPNQTRIDTHAEISLMGVIEHFSDGSAKKAAAVQVATAQTVIPPRKLLEALK